MINFVLGAATAIIVMIVFSCLAINPREDEDELQDNQSKRKTK